jgi:predicted dehydrogenase
VGANVEQTRELCARAEAVGVRAFASLQARASAPAEHLRDLLAEGFIGRAMSASVYAAFSYWGEPVASAYTADVKCGASILTIPGGHGLDLMTWLLGEAADVTGVEARFRDKARAADADQPVYLTAPEQFAAVGRLSSGAVFSAHFVGAAPRGEFYQLRIVGNRGELAIQSQGMPEIAPLTISGAQGREDWRPLPTPARYLEGAPKVSFMACNMARLYTLVARDLQTGGR